MQIRRHHPVKRSLPPLHRRGISRSRGGELPLDRRGISRSRGGELADTDATTPSGCACHPSTGGELPFQGRELPCADTMTPPRQAELDTPPGEGNCRSRRGIGGYGCHHPVRLRLPPLQRRGIAAPQEGNTTPSGFVCHPSRGGELPLQWKGIGEYGCHHPVSFACHPSRGGELAGPPEEVGIQASLPPLQEGNWRVRMPPPRQAELDTPPEEGNCLVQIRSHHPVKRSLTPLQRRGISRSRGGELAGTDATTPSSGA